MNSIEWLSRLVFFDTTSRNSNLALIDVIRTWLEQHDIAVTLTLDHQKQKANLLATIPTHTGSTTGGIILSGHTDVVPVDDQHWDTDPFRATQIEDRIYGRGTCDMKGFIAVILAFIPQFKQAKLTKPVHLALSYDEEVGCIGARHLIAEIEKLNIKPTACIVGEPTEMRPVTAHKGIHLFRCRFHGFAVHSSLVNQGCNALEYAAQLIAWLRRLANQLREEGPFDPDFDVPFTSLSTNRIHAGIAVNTVPDFCEFFFELRHLPEVNPQQIAAQVQQYINENLLPTMQKEYAHAAVEIDIMAAAPGLSTPPDQLITQLVRNLTQEHAIHKVAYATEAGLFQQAGIPTLVCGPGNIEQAHRANEYVTVGQLARCEEFLQQLVDQYLL